MKHSIWTRYGFAWVTGGFFLISLVGHWVFGWFVEEIDRDYAGRHTDHRYVKERQS